MKIRKCEAFRDSVKLLGTNGIFQRKLLSLKGSHYCIWNILSYKFVDSHKFYTRKNFKSKMLRGTFRLRTLIRVRSQVRFRSSFEVIRLQIRAKRFCWNSSEGFKIIWGHMTVDRRVGVDVLNGGDQWISQDWEKSETMPLFKDRTILYTNESRRTKNFEKYIFHCN